MGGKSKRRSMRLVHPAAFSLDCWRESIPPAAKRRIKPGPFGASDLTG